MRKHYRGKRHMYARRTVKIGRDKRRLKKHKRFIANLSGFSKTIRSVALSVTAMNDAVKHVTADLIAFISENRPSEVIENE